MIFLNCESAFATPDDYTRAKRFLIWNKDCHVVNADIRQRLLLRYGMLTFPKHSDLMPRRALPRVSIDTTCGRMVAVLFTDEAPIAAGNFLVGTRQLDGPGFAVSAAVVEGTDVVMRNNASRTQPRPSIS